MSNKQGQLGWAHRLVSRSGGYISVAANGVGSCGHEYNWWVVGGRKHQRLEDELSQYPNGRWVRVNKCAQCEQNRTK